jgi:hypothetical protein
MNPQLHLVLFWLSMLGGLSALVYVLLAYLKARSNRPFLVPCEIVFEEWHASGHSMKSLITRFGGASGCLRLVVTADLVWVTSWFPFSLLTPVYDLEHMISKDAIYSIGPVSCFGRKGVHLEYLDGAGKIHALKLFPRHRDRFLQALAPADSCRTAC